MLLLLFIIVVVINVIIVAINVIVIIIIAIIIIVIVVIIIIFVVYWRNIDLGKQFPSIPPLASSDESSREMFSFYFIHKLLVNI